MFQLSPNGYQAKIVVTTKKAQFKGIGENSNYLEKQFVPAAMSIEGESHIPIIS